MAKKKTATDEKPTHRVKTPVRHDGDDYAPGETITLEEEQAAAMGNDVVEPLRSKEATSTDSGATK
jgi:hypothetical protein